MLRVLSYQPGLVNLQVRTTTPAFLVSSEAYHPGWRGFLDGSATPVYIANAAFNGVAIPPGQHTISLEFAPPIACGPDTMGK